MAARTKYIILKKVQEDYSTVTDVPIIFSDMLTHANVARQWGGKDNVASAGFVSVTEDWDGTITCEAWGKSTSIGVASRDEDYAILTRVFTSPW